MKTGKRFRKTRRICREEIRETTSSSAEARMASSAAETRTCRGARATVGTGTTGIMDLTTDTQQAGEGTTLEVVATTTTMGPASPETEKHRTVTIEETIEGTIEETIEENGSTARRTATKSLSETPGVGAMGGGPVRSNGGTRGGIRDETAAAVLGDQGLRSSEREGEEKKVCRRRMPPEATTAGDGVMTVQVEVRPREERVLARGPARGVSRGTGMVVAEAVAAV